MLTEKEALCSCKTALHKQGLSQNMPTANSTGPVLILGPLSGSGQQPGDSKKNTLELELEKFILQGWHWQT